MSKYQAVMEQNIYKKFNAVQNQVRFCIMNEIIDTEQPFSLEGKKLDVMKKCGITEECYWDCIDALKVRDGIVTDEEGNVNFSYPVSAMPTKHHVTLADGRSYCAMCAIDALGSAFTFQQDVEIHSECSQCGEPVCVKIENKKMTYVSPKNLHALTFSLGEFANWAGSC